MTGSASWRYHCISFDHYTRGGVWYDYAKIVADSYWKDKLIRRTPHIRVWDEVPGLSGWGGYLEWDS